MAASAISGDPIVVDRLAASKAIMVWAKGFGPP